jgi:hypothetical protein
LKYADGVLAKMDKDLILIEDVHAVIEYSRNSDEYVIHPQTVTCTGICSGSLKIGRTTYWVCFEEEKIDGEPLITVISVYSHRLAIEKEAVWTDPRRNGFPAEAGGTFCAKHSAELIEMEAEFSYLGRFFKHIVLRCPICGYVYVTEELARGRMREVEMALEDK